MCADLGLGISGDIDPAPEVAASLWFPGTVMVGRPACGRELRGSSAFSPSSCRANAHWHEAWNPGPSTGTVPTIEVWNPHLKPTVRVPAATLIGATGGFDKASAA